MFTDGLLKEVNRREGTVGNQEVQRGKAIHDVVKGCMMPKEKRTVILY